MKQIKLMGLKLINFKGIKLFVLDADGKNQKVLGDNGTGKTTLYDAFLWTLFNKDSMNNTKFAIKTLDMAGKEASGLEHAVEVTLSVDGNLTTLKKAYKEVWTKKRSAPKAEFKGHTNDYYIDGVPAKQKEFTAYISELIDEDTFKLLTNPAYFNEILKPEQRRKVLLEVCGDITDQDVIDKNEQLAKLPEILGNRTLEKQKQYIASRKKEINQELDRIPIRIDEINLNLPELDGLDKQALESEIQSLNSQIDEKQDLISNIRNGNATVQKQKEIQEIEIQLLEIKQQHESGSKDELYRLQTRIQEEESNLSLFNSKVENLKNEKRYNDENVKRIDEELNKLRQEWSSINEQQFEHTDQCECPSCGQSLPEEQVQAAREKALTQFNLNKSKQLEEIDAKGKQTSGRRTEIISSNVALAKEYEKLNGQIDAKQVLIGKLKTQLKQVEEQVTDVTENTQYVAKLKEKQQLQSEIASLKETADQSIQDVQLAIAELKAKRDQLQADLGKFAAVKQSEDRIKELEAQERELAAEFEKLEEGLFLIEEFTRTKVDMLEEKINSKFKYARFKLFDVQVNGGLNDICDTTYQGVPYDKGLNNAARINVGLDIINTLSEHYGVSAPIFIDNAEAVTKLIDTDAQLISLIVSGQDKQLRVENSDAEVKEAI
ncbi:AAA family ATPase [Siminovitchia terrae]|uniref:AAA family ATPase n=1 Tax=Siminovitchia terrae TaxID=1914933 RepID=UPI0028A927AC|nr:AAA family ATPase [Siminovitchia terrae]